MFAVAGVYVRRRVILVVEVDGDAEKVCFKSSGDVTFEPAGGCGSRSGDGEWSITIVASRTPGEQTITAKGQVCLEASAVLDVGGGRWFEGSEGPSPGREHAGMAYDEANGVTVLFGGGIPGATEGSYGRAGGYTPLGDTWVYDGTRWEKIDPPPASPASPQRRGHGL